MRIAIVDKQPSNIAYSRFFPLPEEAEVEVFHLSSTKVAKLLKKDVDLQLDVDLYDFVILVGSEAAKYFAKVTSVTTYAGHLIEDKYIPIINPAMLAFKPDAQPVLDRAVEKMTQYFAGILPSNNTKYKAIAIQDEKEALEYLLKVEQALPEVIAIDTETSALYCRDGYLLGVSLSYKLDEGVYISADCLNEEVEACLKSIINNAKRVVMHNEKFDSHWIKYHLNIDLGNKLADDTMLQHYLLDETPGTHGLKTLALKYTDLGDYDKELEEFKTRFCKENKVKSEDFSYDMIPFDIISKYAALDTVATINLDAKFLPLIRKSEKLSNVYDTILRPGSKALRIIEDIGVPFDKGRLNKAQLYLDEEIKQHKENMYKLPEIAAFEARQGQPLNPNSPIQLRKLFFDFLGLRSNGKLTGTKELSTDAEVLSELAEQSEIPRIILDLRQKLKIKNTYIDKVLVSLDRDSRLRTNFNLAFTTSGRLSSSGKLNMQQIPRDNPIVKGCIRAREGYVIVSQDLGTAEMYYAAVLSGDTNLMKVFQSGGDFHSAVAKMVFNLSCSVDDVKKLYPGYRQAAKAISFGILYGSGPAKVAKTVSDYYMQMHIEENVPLEIFTIIDAQDAIKKYFKTYKKLERWLNDTKADIMRDGFIYSAFGRKRRLRNVVSADKGIAASDVRSGLNFTIQSVASDVNFLGAIDMVNYISKSKMDAKIFALVHDSILAEVHNSVLQEYLELAKSCVQKDRGLTIPNFPIKVDQEYYEDYSFGKFEKQYPELV